MLNKKPSSISSDSSLPKPQKIAKLFWPVDALTFAAIVYAGTFLISLGVALISLTPRPQDYLPQRAVMGLDMWGALFILGGFLYFLKIFIHRHEKTSLAIHAFAAFPVVFWTVLFYPTHFYVAMTSYTFHSLTILAIPFLQPLGRLNFFNRFRDDRH